MTNNFHYNPGSTTSMNYRIIWNTKHSVNVYCNERGRSVVGKDCRWLIGEDRKFRN